MEKQWEPKQGEKVYWDGIAPGGSNQPAGEYTVCEVWPGTSTMPYKMTEGLADFTWTSLDHLRPLAKEKPKKRPRFTTPPFPKPSGEKVNVLCIDKQGKLSRYHFYGVPDWKRVERETIGEGFAAAIIWPKQTLLTGGGAMIPDECALLCSREIDITDNVFLDELPLSGWGYFPKEEIPATITAVRAALKPKPLPVAVPEKPEHYDGEPFTGENASSEKLPDGYMLVYTGKSGRVNLHGEENFQWFVDTDGAAWYGISSETSEPRPILRAVPEKPKVETPVAWEPKDGEEVLWDGVYVYENGNDGHKHRPGKYTVTIHPQFTVKYKLFPDNNWTTIEHLSPLPIAVPEPVSVPSTWAQL